MKSIQISNSSETNPITFTLCCNRANYKYSQISSF